MGLFSQKGLYWHKGRISFGSLERGINGESEGYGGFGDIPFAWPKLSRRMKLSYLERFVFAPIFEFHHFFYRPIHFLLHRHDNFDQVIGKIVWKRLLPRIIGMLSIYTFMITSLITSASFSGPLTFDLLIDTVVLLFWAHLKAHLAYNLFFWWAPLCGLFGVLSKRRADDKYTLIPSRFFKKLNPMGQHTQVRGEQAGGGIMMSRDRKGNHRLVGYKDVNPKRANQTSRILRKIRWRGIRACWVRRFSPANPINLFFHWRFGTSSPPSKKETHPHAWRGEQKATTWKMKEPGKPEKHHHPFDLQIGHNGEFEGLEKNNHLSVFGESVTVEDVGHTLDRILGPNKTEGDSPNIVGMLNLLYTQGRWQSAARLAYLMEIEVSFKYAFVNATNHKEIENKIREWGLLLEQVFLKHKDAGLFRPDAVMLKEVYPQGAESFIDDMVEALDRDSSYQSWPHEKKKAFAETALYVFLNNDLEHAVQMFMTMPMTTSSFGLGVVSSEEPDRVILAAKGQPITLGYDTQQEAYYYASESAAVLSALDFNTSKLLDLEGQSGKIMSLTMNGPKLFSMEDHRYLTEKEIEKHWIPLKDNPNFENPIPPQKGWTRVKRDIHDIAKVLTKIFNDWKRRERNQFTAERLANHLKDKALKQIRWRIQKETLAKQYGQFYKDEISDEVDLLLLGEEKSYETSLRFKQDLLRIFPTLNVKAMKSEEYLKRISGIFSGTDTIILGPTSIVLGVSQSGQTFSTLAAIRDLEARNQKGLLLDVFGLTGEWYSKIGQALGMSYHSNALFHGRVFSNFSGWRRSEAASVTTNATDFLFSMILIEIVKKMHATFNDTSFLDGTSMDGDQTLHFYPYNITQHIDPPAIEIMEQRAEWIATQQIPIITGIDPDGNPIPSLVHRRLKSKALRWGDHFLEPLMVILMVVTYTAGSLLLNHHFGIPPFFQGFVGYVAKDLFSLEINLELIQHLDIFLYATQFWLFAYLLRVLQGRKLFARTGNRSLVIASPVGKLLRNYVSRLQSMALGYNQISIHGTNLEEGLSHDHAPDVNRGTLIFAQNPDAELDTETLKQTAEGGRMVVSWADGIRNFKVGPEILVIGHNHNGNSKIDTLSLRDSSQPPVPGLENLPEKSILPDLLDSRFGQLEFLVAGQVFFWIAQEKVCLFSLTLYRTKFPHFLKGVLELPFVVIGAVLARIFSYLFIKLFSLFMRIIFGTGPRRQVFVLGKSQNGSTIASTQLIRYIDYQLDPPPARDIRGVAAEIQAAGKAGPTAKWVPQGSRSHIPAVLAHLFDVDKEV